ncbi:MAG: hypothetical protein E6R00_04235 [Gammaproteobacteria bacterium]|nr:MAG: hypothetical protein E6R00_04235 [Gammaproteobacteria bacterium]
MAGRKEILTETLAQKIAKMIEQFPDNEIPVTWENVIAHSKKRFGYGGNRQMLGSKEWDGRKIIAEAFSEAKSVQRRMKSDSRPKYRNAARAVLLNQITKLEAEKLALKEELEKVRAQQISQLDAFLNDTLDIRILVGQALSAGADSVDELKLRRMTKATTVKR